MLTTERPWTATTAAALSPTGYGLRLHDGTEVERLISIPPGKHSIGSGPRCSLRLQYEGVQPLECLIVRNEAGLRVRRWSDDTLLNGLPFDEASLTGGDMLSLGPVDLEVVVPQQEEPFLEREEPFGEVAETALESVDAALAGVYEVEADLPFVADVETQALQPTESHSVWDAPEPAEPPAAAAATTTAELFSGERRIATSIARRRSRRVLAALRRQRHDFDELVARVSDLERQVEQALTEPERAAPDPVNAADAPTQQAEARSEPDAQDEVLKSELGDVREQLATREVALAQAQYSIDVLERQLIDSQHTMHAFANERIVWEKQFDELESRLAEYVQRIQELERQLDQVCAANAEATPATPSGNTAWATESHASEPVAGDFVDAEFVSTVEEGPWGAPADEGANWEEVVDETAPAEAGQMPVEPVAESVDEPVESTTDVPAAVFEEPVTESEEPAADADDALEQLRGLSIWRQEPEVAAEESDVGSWPTTVDEESEPPHQEQASFIDRYAHLLPADDAATEPPTAAPQSPVVAEAAPAASDNEESVEQYMAKLMGRMRGAASGRSEADEVAANTSTLLAPGNAAVDVGAIAEVAAPNQEPITDIEEMRSKVNVSELASDRLAMRALANQSARHAIGVHTARTLRRKARTRFIVALLGASAGLYLLLDAPGWNSLQFAGGCVAAFAAIYWGKLTLGSLIKGIQVGAFEDIDEDVDPVKSLHPPLPIDVERPKD